MTHRYTVLRKLWTDMKGWRHMSDYWQLECVCGWRGERITQPGRAQSKQRVEEWEQHLKDAT